MNRPAGILSANEKLYALHFADLMPETLVSRDTPALLDFLDELGGEMIVKPLDGKGGEGIFHVRRDDRNLTSILEQGTAFGSRPLMAQRYLSEVPVYRLKQEDFEQSLTRFALKSVQVREGKLVVVIGLL